MPSPLAALMGLANGAMGLLQKVFSQASTRQSGFEQQLTAALEGEPEGGMPLLRQLMSDPGTVDEELLTALLGNPQAVPLLQYLSAMKSMGLSSGDVRALLLGDPQGLSDQGLVTILASCGAKEGDIAGIMADPERCAGLKARLAGSLSGQVHRQSATTGMDIDRLIELATTDQTTYDAVVVRFVVSKGSPGGTARPDENLPHPVATTPAQIARITAQIKESLHAAVNQPDAVQEGGSSSLLAEAAKARVVSAEQAQGTEPAAKTVPDANPEATVKVLQGMEDLENTFNVPGKIVRDLLLATDPQVRKAAVDEATARVTDFLETNAGSDLPERSTHALSVLKAALSDEEYTGIDKALRSFNQDLATSIQPLNLDRTLFEALSQKPGDAPAEMAGRYTREVLDQVRQAVPAAAKSGEGSITIRLNPPMLGRVDIDIRVEDGQILASFKVDQPVTRDILQQNMHVLKEALSEQGVKAAQFVVSTDTFNARDHREALTWFGQGNGRGGFQGHGQGRQKGEAGSPGDPGGMGTGYDAVRRYSGSSGLDIFA